MSQRMLNDMIIEQPAIYRHRVLAVAGNGEIRKQLMLSRYSEDDIARMARQELIIGTLLSDLLTQPTAHYYEPNTRDVVLENRALFDAQHGIFVLGTDVEGYAHDAELKKTEYPTRSHIYGDNKFLTNIVTELSDFGPATFRKGSIGELTSDLWKESFCEGGRGDALVRIIVSCSTLTDSEKARLVSVLLDLPDRRGRQAFDGDFVEQQLRITCPSIPSFILLHIRKLLLDCYLRANTILYNGSIVGSPAIRKMLFPGIQTLDRYDTDLFLRFTEMIGIREIVSRLTASNVVDIKATVLEFMCFRDYYFTIVDAASCSAEASLARLRDELSVQNDLETEQIRTRILEATKPLLLECVRELGFCKDLSPLYHPVRDDVYRFKKTMVDYSRIPFIRFRDDLIHEYEHRCRQMVDHELRANEPAIFSFIGCTINNSQIGDSNAMVLKANTPNS